nr:hypothetical protein [Tanacetum cinerariifolium]
MADFHHLDDAREIWLAVKARFDGNEESKKMRKTMLKQEFSEFRVSEEEGLHKRYDRGTIAPTHSAFIGATSTTTKMGYSDQPSHFSSITYTSAHSGSLMEDVLQSFVAENKPIQQLVYEYFEHVDQMDMEELDIKWQMAMLSLRINKFQKKAGRKINFNNKDSARHKPEEGKQVYGLMAGFKSDFADPAVNAAGSVYDAATEFVMMGISSKVQTCPFDCDSKLSELKKNYAHLETMYNDSFIQVQAYKNTVKTLELQKDWYHKTQLALEKNVRILSANLENTTNTLKYSKTLYDQAKIEKKEWEVKLVESLARFDKWKASSKNLAKLINSSMTTRTKLGLGCKEYFGSDEVFDLSTPSIFNHEPVTREVKSFYERFVKAGDMHEVPPSITGTFMPTSSNSKLEETQVTFGLKSPTSITTSESNDSVSCDNSDKSSESKTHDFASCVSSPTTTNSFSTVDVKILPKSGVTDPSPLNGISSCSIKENVKPPSDLCNKRRNNYKNNFVRNKTCFVCGSKSHLIKDCHVYNTVDNFSSIVLKAASVLAGSRNYSASTTTDRFILAASRNRSASIHADRFIPTASRNRSAFIYADRFIPAASRNRSASIHAGRSIPAASRNTSASSHAGRSIPTASRNRPASIHAGRHIPAGRSNKPAPFSAGQTVPTGWINHAARPFFGPTNLYFDNVHLHMHKDIGIVDSGCSRSMIGNKEKLVDFVQVKGCTVTFGGGDGKITGKGTIRTSKLYFENVFYVEELQNFNLFSPEQHINYLLAKASLNESTKWHIRMAHVNFKTINKLAKLGLVEGLPLKLFTNEHDCVACNKEKQHKASYKAVFVVRTIFKPFQLLHMDLFGPTSIRSIDHKYYSLVVTDDFSRFCWAFFLGTKDESFYILKDFITLIENQLNKKVKESSRKGQNRTKMGSVAKLGKDFDSIVSGLLDHDHPKSQIIGPVDTPIQTRHKFKEVEEQSFIATIYQKIDPALLQFCLFSCFLSQVEPKKISDALQDPSWVEAMQEELL